jgi:hypothetical protein
MMIRLEDIPGSISFAGIEFSFARKRPLIFRKLKSYEEVF